jgi:hypothetical protein
MTIPRLVIVSYFLSELARIYDKNSTNTAGGGILAASTAILTIRLILAEFILQFVSNLYCSITLLFQAYQLTRQSKALNGHTSSSDLGKRFKFMIRVLASSFIVPVCIELAVIISTLTTDDQLVRESILWTNTYVSLHCAVLATVWSSIGQQANNNNNNEDSAISSNSSRIAAAKTNNKVSTSSHSPTSTLAAHHHQKMINREDVERSASFSTLTKPPTLSLSDHGSPDLDFSGWEKSSSYYT